MKVKKVNRYYCDFCKKASCSGGHMKSHESHCTMNPNRICRMCHISDNTQAKMETLLSILPDPEMYRKTETFSGFQIFTGLEEAIEKVIPDLGRLTGDCPTCILAALRQKKIPILPIKCFDYPKECAAFFKDMNEERNNYY